MPQLSVAEAIKEIKSGKFHPVYFLTGDEPFFIDLVASEIQKTALNDAERGFNETLVYGKEIKILEVLSAAQRFPMMAARTVVIIREAQEIGDFYKEAEAPKGSKGKSASAGTPVLSRYLQSPTPTTVLVFCFKHKKPDGKRTLTKDLAKYAAYVDCQPIKDSQIPAFIQDHLAARHIKATPQTLHLMADHIGSDLQRIEKEIEKLAVHFPQGGELTSDMVQQFVGISREYNVFELQNAMLQRNTLKAQKIARYFNGRKKEHPLIMTIASLFGFFSKVLAAHSTPDKSPAGIAKTLKLPPFLADQYAQACRVFPLAKTMDIIHLIRQADMRSKGIGNESGFMDEEAILEELVFRIMH